MKKVLLVVLGILVILILALSVKAWLMRSQQIQGGTLAKVEIGVDQTIVARHLSEAAKLPTVSELREFQGEKFLALQRFLEETYPEVHARLTREVVNQYSLLYTWPGKDVSKNPILLMAHQDVVPIDPSTEAAWDHPGFSGEIRDGFVWGRGSLDCKSSLIGLMEATEALLKKGFIPERTIYLAFGHDEELGGPQGASAVAKALRERGVKFEYLLDEGGVITDGAVMGLSKPIALVGTAEKGIVALELSVSTPSGSAISPPAQTAIGILSAAITKLEKNPFPVRLDGATTQMFDYLGAEMPFGMKMIFANRWLFNPLLQGMFSREPATNSMIRTTAAVTMVNGGFKESMLPTGAKATICACILPGESIESLIKRLRTVINDSRVTIKVTQPRREPSRISDTNTRGFDVIQKTLKQVFPEAIVAPFLLMGGTDSAHFADLAEEVYRFSPIFLSLEDQKRVHGLNERIAIAALDRCVQFYYQFISNAQ